jgi:hypothetical protein
MEETLLTKIIDFLFGKKYYANIINTRGTDKCEITGPIFRTKAAAMEHKENNVDTTWTYLYIETVSFRSRKEYKQIKLQ